MVDALVLAGGRADPVVAPGVPNKAFAPLCGRPMVEFVLRALRGSAVVRRIALVGPGPLPAALGRLVDAVVPEASGLLQNVEAGLAALPGARVLLAAADVPLLTPAAVDEFLRGAERLDAEVVYGIVSREEVVRRLPGARKTFVRVREGRFTGGSLVVLDARAFARLRPVVARVVAARKRPWDLARLFGASAVLGLCTGRLSIVALERRAFALTGVRMRALVARLPEIALDVDAAEMRLALEEEIRRHAAREAAIPDTGLAPR